MQNKAQAETADSNGSPGAGVLRSLALGASFVVAAAAFAPVPPARADERGFGPEFGTRKILAEFETLTDRPDTDDYVTRLMDGETLKVKVKAAGKSGLLVGLRLIDPDGDDRTAGAIVKIKKGGRAVTLKPFTVDKTGPWTVRLSALDGTAGDYVAKFKLKNPAPLAFKKQTLSGAGASRPYSFDALDGTLIDCTLKWSKKEQPAAIDDLVGPLGQVSGLFGEDDVAIVVKNTTAKVKKHPLDAGTGTYDASVAIADGTATYSLKVSLTPPPRPSGTHTITSVNDPHLDEQPTPVRSAAGQPLRITGRNFAISPVPTVFVGSTEATVVAVGGARNFVDVIVPAGVDGAVENLIVVNPDGQSTVHADYLTYVPEAAILQTEIIEGSVLGANQVLRDGNAVVEVTGTDFLPADTVTLGGTTVTRRDSTTTSFRVVVPIGPAGLLDLVLTDEFGRVQSVPGAVRRVGWDNLTGTQTPTADAVDDLSAWDVAIGDLDGDGRDDDAVVFTYNRHSRAYPGYERLPPFNNWYDVYDNPVGTRAEYTRVLIGDAAGRLIDRTSSHVPDAGSDSSGFGDWNARDVALGDVDGDSDLDIVLAGSKGGATNDASDFGTIAVFRNGGGGTFSAHEAWWPAGFDRDVVIAVTETYSPGAEEQEEDAFASIHGPRSGPISMSCVALGDLDGDGDQDIVAGTAGHDYMYVYNDPGPVDYSQSPPYVNTSDISPVNEGRYYSGTWVLDNDIDGGNGFVDVTQTAVPDVGLAGGPAVPAFPARDLAIGDVDGDDDLDVVVTWNNPASVIPLSAKTAYGYYQAYTYGTYRYSYVSATPAVATRVLLNDGTGTLTDGTATWMPAASGNEYWHGHRLALADLDGDDDLDMVVVHRRALNEFKGQAPQYTGSSLRILRNDGSAFVDVTSTALPAVTPGADTVYRGRALAVVDIDLDGFPEIVVGTELPRTVSSERKSSSIVLWGSEGLVFTRNDDFAVPDTIDTGEMYGLAVGDLDNDGNPALILVSETAPHTSTGGEALRAFEWAR